MSEKELQERIASLEKEKAEAAALLKQKDAELATFAADKGKDDDKKKADPDNAAIMRYQEEIDKLRKQGDENKARLEEQIRKNEEVYELDRKRRVKAFAEGIKFPGLRNHFLALYDMATAKENLARKVVFTEAEGKTRETTLEVVVQEFSEAINKLAESKLFSQQSSVPEFRYESGFDDNEEDAGKEVDKRVREYCEKHSMKYTVLADYKTAMRAVLDSDAELKRAYSGR